MRWIVIVVFIVAAFAWINFLKTDRRAVHISGVLLGMMPFLIVPLHLLVGPYPFPGWIGYAKGWDISLVDVLAISVLLSGRVKGPSVPLKWPIIAYAVVVTLTVPLAKFPTFAFAYSLQLVRMLLVFFAAAKIAMRPEGARGVFEGLVLGLTVQCGFALQARLGGAIQTGGNFGHQNLLGYVTHMVLLPSFALLAGGRWTRFATLGLAAGAFAVIMTASRATIVIAGVGIAITYIVVSVTNWTSRKATFGMVSLVLMLAAVPLAQNSLGRRFEAAGGGKVFSEDTEREAFEKAAWMMIGDHPLGVGPNHYAYNANVGGYNNKANVIWSPGSRTANVHNAYLLVYAETGLAGLLCFCAILGLSIFTCFTVANKYKRSGYSELVAGVGCGLISVAIHSKVEWMFVMGAAQYVLFIAIGLAAGGIVQARRPPRRRKRPPPPVDEESDDPVALEDSGERVAVT